MTADDRVLQDLKRDLQDGDDLMRAAALVSDAVGRRIRRVQRSLDLLDPDDEGARAVHRRLQGLLDQYRHALERHGESLQDTIEQYQPDLDDLAERLVDHESDD